MQRPFRIEIQSGRPEDTLKVGRYDRDLSDDIMPVVDGLVSEIDDIEGACEIECSIVLSHRSQDHQHRNDGQAKQQLE